MINLVIKSRYTCRRSLATAVAVAASSIAPWQEECGNDCQQSLSLQIKEIGGDVFFRSNIACCEASPSIYLEKEAISSQSAASLPSWFRRRILAPIGISLPKPRLLTPEDPALKLSARCVTKRQNDERRMRKILEKAPSISNDPDKMKALSEELFEVTYGKGVTAQEREDFLARYGCTGWNEKVLGSILEIAKSRGVVEIGAGHGQWARALNEAYEEQKKMSSSAVDPRKRFDFVLAFDDNSNLPLNTHIYNPYTKPHHEYFGNVQKLERGPDHLGKVMRSWACRGRVLLLVYPPPGDMAIEVVKSYVTAAPQDNNTVVFVGEGRGGANGDDSLFDYFECGEWDLVEEMSVLRPPGDKGYEKLFVLRRRKLSNE